MLICITLSDIQDIVHLQYYNVTYPNGVVFHADHLKIQYHVNNINLDSPKWSEACMMGASQPKDIHI